jgi:hypothetical protein
MSRSDAANYPVFSGAIAFPQCTTAGAVTAITPLLMAA